MAIFFLFLTLDFVEKKGKKKTGREGGTIINVYRPNQNKSKLKKMKC